MAGIGGVICDFVKGTASGPTSRVSVFHMPGFSGYGAHVTALGDTPFEFIAIRYGRPGFVRDWITALEALQGTIVSIVDDWGAEYTAALITRVTAPRRTAARGFTTIPGFDGQRAEVRVSGVLT